MLAGGALRFWPCEQGCDLELLLVRAREWFRELCRGKLVSRRKLPADGELGDYVL